MAEDKILDSEIIDEADLEKVAGGTVYETIQDAKKLNRIGKLSFNGPLDLAKVADIIRQLGNDLGVELGIRYEHNMGNVANRYCIGNNEYSREQFWKIIDRLYK